VGDGGICTYAIVAVDTNGVPTGAREVGMGQYVLTGTKLNRLKCFSSSNGGAFVDLQAGNKRVFLTIPAGSYGPSIFPPGPSSDWTWANQGSALIVDGNDGSMTMTIPDTGTVNWRLLYQSVPAAPYSVIARLHSIQEFTNSNITGIYFHDGTKLMGLEFVTQTRAGLGLGNILRVERITNVNTDGSTAYQNTVFTINPTTSCIFVRLRNNGTTLYFDIALDGVSYYPLYNETVGSFITPTHVGFGGLCSTGDGFNAQVTLSSWVFLSTAAA
jgi:hypothetical protein